MRGSRRRCPSRSYVEYVAPVACARCGRPGSAEADPPLCLPCFEAEIDRLSVRTIDLSDEEAAAAIKARLDELGVPGDVVRHWLRHLDDVA